MRLVGDGAPGPLCLIEEAGPVRLFGLVCLAFGAGGIVWSPDWVSQLFFGLFLAVGGYIQMTATRIEVCCDPALRTIRIDRQSWRSKNRETIPFDAVDKIELLEQRSAHNSMVCALWLLPRVGARVLLSTRASWGLDAKKEAGAALATHIAVPFCHRKE
jgi:hypothetical protein